MKIIFTVFCLLISSVISAQIGVGANFGIEADIYSGDATSGINSDDWFYNGISGAGVIDKNDAATYLAQLIALNNITFDLNQSIPNYSVSNGTIWYSTRYGHDYIGSGGNDLTIFQNGKNGDDPSLSTDWQTTDGPMLSKVDLQDAAVHMRRDGINTTDDLWVDLMASTLGTGGDHFIDFELFVSEITTTALGFTNSGSDEGHTAWTFNADGSVATVGDLIVGFSFGGGGVANLEVRIWVDNSLFSPGGSPGPASGFTWGASIDGTGSTYGYAQIVVPAGALFEHVNGTATSAPPWGTYDTSGPVFHTPSYKSNSLAEVGINFTTLGFDPQVLFGQGAACDSPFSAVLIKSRSSSSFTSALKDFMGPYDFLGTANIVNTTSFANPGDFNTCTFGEVLTLQAEFISPSAEYIWTSLTPGVVFPANGLSVISGVGMDNVNIDTPGSYQLGLAPLLGCNATTNIDDIVNVNEITCADLSLTKTVDNTTPVIGSNVTFSISVTNGGAKDATGIAVTDQLPSGYTYVSDNGGGSYNSSTGVWSVGNLSNGSIITLLITATVNGSGVFYNTAEVTASDNHDVDSTPNNNDPTEDDQDGASTTPIIPGDSDADGLIDSIDIDDDNDGITDAQELCGTDPVVIITTSTIDIIIDLDRYENETSWTLVDPSSNIVGSGGSYSDGDEIIAQSFVVNIGGNYTFTINDSYGDGLVGPSGTSDSNNSAGYSIAIDGSNFFASSNYPNFGLSSAHTVPIPSAVTITYSCLGSDPNGDDDSDGTLNYQDPDYAAANGSTLNANGVMSSLDSDGDGIINSLDLDSDNDGIFDIVEAGGIFVAGVADSDDDGRIDAASSATVGINGLFDLIETAPDTSLLNYAINDSDLNGTYDPYQLDSDNDGCNDVNEAGFIDNNGDGVLGPLPTVVDTNGLITSGSDGYTIPADLNTNSIFDFQENGPDANGNSIPDGCETDLSLAKIVDNATPSIGDTIIFSLTVTNNGTSSVSGVSVRELLQPGLSYVSNTATAGSYDSITGIWDFTSEILAVGDTETLTVTVTIDPNCGEIINRAEIISSSLTDIDSTPNNGG